MADAAEAATAARPCFFSVVSSVRVVGEAVVLTWEDLSVDVVALTAG